VSTAHRSRAPLASPAALDLPAQKVGAVQAAVLAWYRSGHRDLPWRRTRDPYAVLVSEIMLQQTQVDRVIPKYQAFLAQYPTLQALAAAPRAEVIRNWAPLGYNLRAVRLHDIAQQAVAQFGGELPKTMDGLRSLRGIGRYTAAAVACFAHGQAEALLDTNVRRALGRIFAAEAPGAAADDRLGWRRPSCPLDTLPATRRRRAPGGPRRPTSRGKTVELGNRRHGQRGQRPLRAQGPAVEHAMGRAKRRTNGTRR
jgi:endonuclease III